jgi:methylmalonyl-CoA carboxyltransferase large subunit
MDSPAETTDEMLAALRELRSEYSRLADRVAALEAARSCEGDESLILAISGAVAAYLGVKARVRQIRLVRSPDWAVHGRASIQGSHRLDVRRSPL